MSKIASIIPKITMKTVDAQPAPRTVTVKEDLVHIFGRAERVNEGSTTYGIFHKYKGTFEAVNLKTGEVYRSSALLLPEIADGILLPEMLARGATLGKEKTAKTPEETGEPVSKDAQPVDFALAIGVVPQESKDESGRGYQYSVRPLMEATTADPLASLRAVSQDAQKLALPAPVPQEKPSEPVKAAHGGKKK